MSMKQFCPVCDKVAIGARGPQSSKNLIILSHPDWADIVHSAPFSIDAKKTTGGLVMSREMSKAGLDLSDFRIVCLWPHEEEDDERCTQLGLELTLAEAKGKSSILLVGAQAVSAFTTYSVNDVNGLQVDSYILSCPIIYALVNPNSVLIAGAGVGEIRFGLAEYAARLREEKLV